MELNNLELNVEKRLETLRQLRDTRQEMLEVMQRRKSDIERKNTNMQRAIEQIAAGRWQDIGLPEQ